MSQLKNNYSQIKYLIAVEFLNEKNTYIYSAKYIIKPPHMIWRTAESLQNSQPLWTKNSAAGRQLGGEIGYVINPKKKKKNLCSRK